MDEQSHHQVSTTNSYPPVFVGREQVAAYLLHHLNESSPRQAAVLIGRRLIGKTAMLKQFTAAAGDGLVAVYIPLRQAPLESERSWLHALIRAIDSAMGNHNFHIPTHEFMPQDESPRNWLAENHLPVILRAIRSQRRMILLLDDAEILAQRVKTSDLPDDTFEYLHSLLGSQFTIALTVDLQSESTLPEMAPLVNPRDVYRLNRLKELHSSLVVQAYLGDKNISDDALSTIQRATGGEPALLQHFGKALADRTQTATISANDVKAIMPAVYAASEDQFQMLWKLLNRDERLVLTALSSILYDDPLRTVNTSMIETWLVETDYPLDMTTINAAVRGLEYRELVEGVASQVKINAGLFQKWLLEHARLTGEHRSERRDSNPRLRSLWPVMIIFALVIVLALLAMSALSENSSNDATPIPTVTLAQEDQ